MKLPPFVKIFALGDERVKDIFREPVEITEKVDGSQFVFGKIGGRLYMRSKGAMIYPESPPDMFREAVSYILSIEDKIVNNKVFYCEYLQKPKHNLLIYNRIPRHYLMLFGISDETGTKFFPYSEIESYADYLGIEAIPLLHIGKIKTPDDLNELLEKESALGGCKVEGIVIKNYHRQIFIGGVVFPLMAAKLVSEKFKEVHRDNWKREFTTRGKWDAFKESFRTEARWLKAIQHLKEKGELEFTPRDIGKLIKEIQDDIAGEEKENILNFLWNEFGKELLRNAVKGFPEFYKRYLAEQNFSKS